MKYDKIIILLLIVIVAMLIIGLFVLNPFISKSDCNIQMVSSDALNVGDKFSIFLSDVNGNPIANAELNITFVSSNGAVTTRNVITDSSGNANIGIDDLPIGGYNVTCSLLKNDKYKENSITSHISINQMQQTTSSTNTQSGGSNGLSSDGYSYYPQYGPAVDARGVTRQQAIAGNMHYIPQRIDGMDAGLYVSYDANAGCYHT